MLLYNNDEVRKMTDEEMVMGLGIVIVILCTIFCIAISMAFAWGVGIGIIAMLTGYYYDEK
jgi:hypothetical protein